MPPGKCQDNRHLWDAIVATAPHPAVGEEDDEADDDRLRFRLARTSLRCGRIERLAGVAGEDRRCAAHRVDPEPLRDGGLLAQQVGADRYGGHLMSWAILDRPDRAPIGCITWARGLQGWHDFQGRFDGRPGRQTVQARTAVGWLRELATADRTGVSGDVA